MFRVVMVGDVQPEIRPEVTGKIRESFWKPAEVSPRITRTDANRSERSPFLGEEPAFARLRRGRLSAGSFGCGNDLVETRVTAQRIPADRKSTRLNSSHGSISYAVFCLKKKKKKQ